MSKRVGIEDLSLDLQHVIRSVGTSKTFTIDSGLGEAHGATVTDVTITHPDGSKVEWIDLARPEAEA